MLSPSEVAALKAIADSSEAWLERSTLAVLAGLILELLNEFLHTKEKPWSEIVLSIVAACIVAVGVYGELRFGARSASANGQLERDSDERVATLNKEAEKLRAQLAWRTLTDEQKDAIRSAASKFPHVRADVFSYLGDPEGENLSDQVVAVFKLATWDVGTGTVAEYRKLISGVRVETGSAQQTVVGITVARIALTPQGEKAAKEMASLLNRIGLSVANAPVPMEPLNFEQIIEPGSKPMSEAPVRIMIGVKPR